MYTMLHTKFQGHQSIGSGEDFLRFLTYMGMAAIWVMWPTPFEQFFFPKRPGGSIWNLVTIGPVVSEEKSFEIVDAWRKTEPAYTISSPGAFGSGELKNFPSYHHIVSCIHSIPPFPITITILFPLSLQPSSFNFLSTALWLWQITYSIKILQPTQAHPHSPSQPAV